VYSNLAKIGVDKNWVISDEVENHVNSTVNKLNWIVQDKRFDFRATNLGKFDYKLLMK
jgi:hypothetical protein